MHFAEPLKLQADAAYLYGAPADGNRFTARLAVAAEQSPVESLPGYFFGDPTLELPREAREVIDTEFPADGTLRQDKTASQSPHGQLPVRLASDLVSFGGKRWLCF